MDKGEIGLLLQQLAALDGPAGSESRVRQSVMKLCARYAPDVQTDALGSVVARRPGAAAPPGRIMLAAHMDEIGLLVTRVEDSFLHVARIGGADPRLLLGQEVTVYPSGPDAGRFPDGLPGYIGLRPPHLMPLEERDKVIPLGDLRVDVGFKVEGLVRVGDRAVLRGPYTELIGGRVASKAMDDRASVAAMIGALGYLAGTQHAWEVCAVATVQEEVGSKGASVTAFRLEPDIALAVDVSFADTPGIDDEMTVPWDKGPAIDWGPNLHPAIVRKLREAAESLEISYVNELVPGPSGTDAWAIQMIRSGIPCGLVSIPTRYLHSSVETLVLADVDRTARLLASFISQLDGDFLARLPEEV